MLWLKLTLSLHYSISIIITVCQAYHVAVAFGTSSPRFRLFSVRQLVQNLRRHPLSCLYDKLLILSSILDLETNCLFFAAYATWWSGWSSVWVPVLVAKKLLHRFTKSASLLLRPIFCWDSFLLYSPSCIYTRFIASFVTFTFIDELPSFAYLSLFWVPYCKHPVFSEDMGLHPLALLASATTAGMRRGGGEDGGVAAVPGLSLASRRFFRTSGLTLIPWSSLVSSKSKITVVITTLGSYSALGQCTVRPRQ